jgi:hypothetical protein
VFEGEHEALRKETVVAEKFATYWQLEFWSTSNLFKLQASAEYHGIASLSI